MKTNEDTIDAILAELSENYQGQFKLTEHTAKVWMRRMAGIDAAAVLASVEEFCNSPSKFPPSAGQIRTRAIELSHGEMTTPSGADAWDRVVQWERDTPQYEYQRETPSEITLTDLEKRALHHIGGTWALGHSQRIEFERAAFIRYFDARISKLAVHRGMTPAARQLVESRRPALPAADMGLDRPLGWNNGALPSHVPENSLAEPTEAELTTLVGQLGRKMGK